MHGCTHTHTPPRQRVGHQLKPNKAFTKLKTVPPYPGGKGGKKKKKKKKKEEEEAVYLFLSNNETKLVSHLTLHKTQWPLPQPSLMLLTGYKQTL